MKIRNKKVRARHIHHLEVFTDNVVGLVINFLLVFAVYNWMLGQDITMSQNMAGTAIFFVAAYIRKYTLRRWFSNWIGRIYERREQVQKQAGKA